MRAVGRRRFLQSSLGVLGLSTMSRHVSAQVGDFDPDFGSATEAARAILARHISSTELVDHLFQRIGRRNPGVNAFLTLNEEAARRAASEADRLLARGEIRGALHGVPIVIKDTFATAGLRTTAGSKVYENHIPARDAVPVRRLREAGAIILGKTNMPEFASDMQSYNDLAGTCRNPWDPERTPGGSTGGGAAALAAGFGFLELGSDIGGSIRTPCHFCGVYGLKPTLGIVPMDGHIPPAPETLAVEGDLNVAGPMARSPQDLKLGLQILAGPASGRAFRWDLPPARGSRARDYRIGFVLDDAFCRVGSDVLKPLSEALEALGRAGFRLSEGWPAGIDPRQTFDLYIRLLAAAFSAGQDEEELALLRRSFDSPWGYYSRAWIEGSDLAHGEWLKLSEDRLRARALWQEYFRDFDAFLMPVNFVPAFPHDQELSFFERRVRTPEGMRQYGDMLRWICFATLTGCPAVAAPVGKTSQGLPVGIQIVGPFQEDATPIALAGHLADVLGGFEKPPGF